MVLPLLLNNLIIPCVAQTSARDKMKVVSFRVPHNAAVQIYNYKEKTARVVFGPELVMLRPDEQFTQLKSFWWQAKETKCDQISLSPAGTRLVY